MVEGLDAHGRDGDDDGDGGVAGESARDGAVVIPTRGLKSQMRGREWSLAPYS